MFDTAVKPKRLFFCLFILSVLPVFFFSCSTVKDYPLRKPFVYQTNIDLEGKYNTNTKKQLTEQLRQQMHDSIQVRKVQKFIFWHTLKNPPVYDSLNAEKSKIYMNALL